MPDHPLIVRLATVTDVPLILQLIQELALYEREPDAVKATLADLHRDGFGPVPRFHCFIAEWLGQAAGFALYFNNYSTWRGHHGVHLEDLFVLPAFRGRGIGHALLNKVASTAVAEGCVRLQWDVLEWNELAIGFYEKMGAVIQKEWRTMRVSDDALLALAQPLPPVVLSPEERAAAEALREAAKERSVVMIGAEVAALTSADPD